MAAYTQVQNPVATSANQLCDVRPIFFSFVKLDLYPTFLVLPSKAQVF